MNDDSDKYFKFLNYYGFNGPIKYNSFRESHKDYIRGNLVISLRYHGSYQVDLVKTKKVIPELTTGDKKIKEVDAGDKLYYDITSLDTNKRIYNSVDFNDQKNKSLWYFSKLIRENTEILTGDLRKLTVTHRLLKAVGIK